MKRELFSSINFSLAENASKLGTREKKAAIAVLLGLCETQQTGKNQKPIKIAVASDRPFDLNTFAELMFEMGIDISSSMQTEHNPVVTSITFHPKPFGINGVVNGIITSRKATDHFIAIFLDYEPSRINSSPR